MSTSDTILIPCVFGTFELLFVVQIAFFNIQTSQMELYMLFLKYPAHDGTPFSDRKTVAGGNLV